MGYTKTALAPQLLGTVSVGILQKQRIVRVYLVIQVIAKNLSQGEHRRVWSILFEGIEIRRKKTVSILYIREGISVGVEIKPIRILLIYQIGSDIGHVLVVILPYAHGTADRVRVVHFRSVKLEALGYVVLAIGKGITI